MIFRKRSAALCMILTIAAATLVHAQNGAVPLWKTFRPDLTTEADFLRLFGKPDNVVIRFIGFDAFQRWRTSGGPNAYDFEYLSPSNDNLSFDGPFGDAG